MFLTNTPFPKYETHKSVYVLGHVCFKPLIGHTVCNVLSFSEKELKCGKYYQRSKQWNKSASKRLFEEHENFVFEVLQR